jgi:hypothetical protein
MLAPGRQGVRPGKAGPLYLDSPGRPGHIRLALSEGRNEPVIAELQEGAPELSAHVNPPRRVVATQPGQEPPGPLVSSLVLRVIVFFQA